MRQTCVAAMTKPPMISVIVAAYNAERTVGDALASVLFQSYPDFEILVCDDASSDATARVVAGIADSRVRLLFNMENSGPGPSRDRAISHARGRWITFLDTDDQFAPGRLETMLQVAENYPDDIIADGVVDCHDTPNGLIPWRVVWGDRYPVARSSPPYRINLAEFVASDRTLIKPFLRKDLALFLRASHGTKSSGEDVAFLLPFFAHGSVIRYIPKPLYYYRLTPGSLSSSRPDRHTQYREVFETALTLFSHAPIAAAAIQAKIESIRRQETYQIFYDALRAGRLVAVWAMINKDAWLIPEFVRRVIGRIPFHLHRILHNGVHRRVG